MKARFYDLEFYKELDILNFLKVNDISENEINDYGKETLTKLANEINNKVSCWKINLENMFDEWGFIKHYIRTCVPLDEERGIVLKLIYDLSEIIEFKKIINYFNTLPILTVPVEKGFNNKLFQYPSNSYCSG